MISLVLSAALAAVPSGAPSASPGYVLEKTEVKRIRGVNTCRIHCPNFTVREWVVFAARAPELPGQSDVRSYFDPEGTVIQELSPLHRGVLAALVPVRDGACVHGIKLRITYEATMHGRKLRPLAPGEKAPAVPPLTSAERHLFLLAYGDIDHKKPAFRQWLRTNQLLRAEGENDVDFARRVFLLIRSRFTYDYQKEMNRHASTVCRAGSADCAGLSILFVAALRANGIPARVL